MRLPHWALVWGLLTVVAASTAADHAPNVDDCLDRLAASCSIPQRFRLQATTKLTSESYVRTSDLEASRDGGQWQIVRRTFGLSPYEEGRITIHETSELLLGSNPFDKAATKWAGVPDPMSGAAPPALRVIRMTFAMENGTKDQSTSMRATPSAMAAEWQPCLHLDLVAVLFGTLPGDDGVSLWDVAREGDRRSVVGSPLVDGHETVRIVSWTRFGERTMWLDPRLGYLPRRIECVREGHHQWGRKTIDQLGREKSGLHSTDVHAATNLVLDDFRFREVEGQPRIVGFHVWYLMPLAGGSETREVEGEVRVSEWGLPTGDTPPTLKTGGRISVGTPVNVEGRVDKRFEWDGRAIAVRKLLNVDWGPIRAQ